MVRVEAFKHKLGAAISTDLVDSGKYSNKILNDWSGKGFHAHKF